MSSREEKRGRWEFTIPEGGLWGWRVVHPDGRTACGDCGYRTLKECVDDAKKYGYVYGLRRGAVMHNLAAGLARAQPDTTVGTRADALEMYELLQKLAASDAGDAKLINELRDDAKRLVGR